jgi:hypothetical protein
LNRLRTEVAVESSRIGVNANICAMIQAAPAKARLALNGHALAIPLVRLGVAVAGPP